MIREYKKLPKNVKDKIPEVVLALEQDKDVVALYAFGSIVKKKLEPLSDLDFGILLTSELDKGLYRSKHLELICLFNDVFRTDEVDLVFLNNAPPSFSYNIIGAGELLYYRDKGEIINFREQLTRYYLDFKYFRDNFDEVFLEGVGFHG